MIVSIKRLVLLKRLQDIVDVCEPVRGDFYVKFYKHCEWLLERFKSAHIKSLDDITERYYDIRCWILNYTQSKCLKDFTAIENTITILTANVNDDIVMSMEEQKIYFLIDHVENIAKLSNKMDIDIERHKQEYVE